VRKVNADDKRQAAELIELDGGDLRREPLDTRKATFGVAAEAGRARGVRVAGEQADTRHRRRPSAGSRHAS
jgi:hypothetical protein